MKYLNWLLRTFLFLILLSFAVKNDQPIELSYFFGYEWHVSLVLVLLLFFAAGVVAGVLALLFHLMRQRKEIADLKRKLSARKEIED